MPRAGNFSASVFLVFWWLRLRRSKACLGFDAQGGKWQEISDEDGCELKCLRPDWGEPALTAGTKQYKLSGRYVVLEV